MKDYNSKVKAIREAMCNGKRFFLHTFLGVLEVTGISQRGDWVFTENGRSWAICSAEIERWYREI